MKQSRLYKEILKIGIDNCFFLLNVQQNKLINTLVVFRVVEIGGKLGKDEEYKITLVSINGTVQAVVIPLKKLKEDLKNGQGEFLIKRDCIKSYKLKDKI